MTEWPLYIGLVLPLAIICIIHFIVNVLIWRKISRKKEFLTSNLTDSPRLKLGTTKIKYSTAVINVSFVTFYTALIFEFLAVDSRLQQYSTFIQIAFAIITTAQGPLIFVYTLCSNHGIKTFSVCKTCCRSTRVTLAVNIDNLSPTTETSTHSLQMATFVISESEKQKESKVIATDTNPAYATVMLRRKRDEYVMTDNELYGNLNRMPRSAQCHYNNKTSVSKV